MPNVNDEKLVLLAIYRSQQNRIDTQELDNLFCACKNVSSKIIVGGDFKAHNAQWGGGKTDQEGTKLAEWFEDNDLHVHPTEFPTRYDYRSCSFIDLFASTISISSIRPLLKTIQFDSDHNVVELLITPTTVQEKARQTYWDWANADIGAIREGVIEFTTTNEGTSAFRNMSPDELDTEFLKISLLLANCIEKYVPLKTLRKGATCSKDAATNKFIEQRRKWNKKKFKINRSIYAGLATYDDLKDTTNAIRRISTIIDQRMTNEKRSTFKKRLEQLHNGNVLHKEVKKLTSYKQRSNISAEIIDGGRQLTNAEKKSNAFAKHFAEIHRSAAIRGDMQRPREIDVEMRIHSSHHHPIQSVLKCRLFPHSVDTWINNSSSERREGQNANSQLQTHLTLVKRFEIV